MSHSHPLAIWLKSQDPPLSRSEFARRIGRDPATITKIIKGHVRPDWTTMDRIKAETNGDISAQDFDAGEAQ